MNIRSYPNRRTAHGFTMIEMIVAIVVTGIVAALVTMFVHNAIQTYFDVAHRADLTDTADTALRRISRELHGALPNSVRAASPQAIEFLPTKGGGRYRAAQNCSGACTGNSLSFDTAVNSFDVIGPSITLTSGDQIVIYNLGIAGADAYSGNSGVNDNRRPYSGAGGSLSTIPITSNGNSFPFDSPSHRFQVISTPVSYFCDLTAGTLTRYWGYAIQTSQPTTAAALNTLVAISGGSALLAQNVTDCQFTYTNGITQSNGIVSLRLSLTQNGETVSLLHEVHVNNVP
jgi:MSHA biogenesis protein MshO